MSYINPVIAVLFMIFLAYTISMFKPFTVFCYAFVLQAVALNLLFIWFGYTDRKKGVPLYANWGDFGILHELFSYRFWVAVAISLFTTLLLTTYVYQIQNGKI